MSNLFIWWVWLGSDQSLLSWWMWRWPCANSLSYKELLEMMKGTLGAALCLLGSSLSPNSSNFFTSPPWLSRSPISLPPESVGRTPLRFFLTLVCRHLCGKWRRNWNWKWRKVSRRLSPPSATCDSVTHERERCLVWVVHVFFGEPQVCVRGRCRK